MGTAHRLNSLGDLVCPCSVCHANYNTALIIYLSNCYSVVKPFASRIECLALAKQNRMSESEHRKHHFFRLKQFRVVHSGKLDRD